MYMYTYAVYPNVNVYVDAFAFAFVFICVYIYICIYIYICTRIHKTFFGCFPTCPALGGPLCLLPMPRTFARPRPFTAWHRSPSASKGLGTGSLKDWHDFHGNNRYKLGGSRPIVATVGSINIHSPNFTSYFRAGDRVWTHIHID